MVAPTNVIRAEDSTSASSASSSATAHHNTNNINSTVASTTGAETGRGSSAGLSNNYHLSSISATNSPMMRHISSASGGGLFVSAPGKIILFGEHATAIAGSIDMRTYVHLFTSPDGVIYLNLPELGLEKTWKIRELQKVCEKLSTDFNFQRNTPPPLEIIVPYARKLSGACEDTCSVQHLAILAFWYLLIGTSTYALGTSSLHNETDSPKRRQSGFSITSVNSQQSLIASANNAAKQQFLEIPYQSPRSISPSSVSPVRYLSPESSFEEIKESSRKLSAKSSFGSTDGDYDGTKFKDLLAVKITVRFKLPACVGLGAYCVAIAAALLQANGLIPPANNGIDGEDGNSWEDKDLDLIRVWAATAESLIHGRASGLDASICTYASKKPTYQSSRQEIHVITYVVNLIFDAIDAIAEESIALLQEQPRISNGGEEENENGIRSGTLTPGGSISTGPLAAHATLQPLTLRPVGTTRTNPGTASGPPSAGIIHPGSISLRSVSPNQSQHYTKRLSTTSASSLPSSLSTRDDNKHSEKFGSVEALNDLAKINNHLLISLGVGHAKIDHICTMMSRFGIYPKMTGAGGGGSLFAFLKPNLDDHGYECWEPILGGPGVMQHNRKPEIFSTPVVPTNKSTGTKNAQLPPGGTSTSTGNATSRSETPQATSSLIGSSSTHRHSTSSNRNKK